MSNNHPILIIGTGLAGWNVAKELRKHDQETPLVMLSEDDGRFYSKPMMSTSYARNQTPEDLVMAEPAEVAAQLQLEVIAPERVLSIDVAGGTLETEQTGRLAWRSLVLALGGKVISPPMEVEEAAVERIFSINSRVDYVHFRAALERSEASKLLIIGAGLIGTEFCNDLLNGGYAVEAVDPLGWSLPTLLPEQCGKTVQAALERLGAGFHFGTVVERVTVGAGGKGVVGHLADGGQVEADLVVSAVGVRPRVGLAQEAGLSVNRGIIVDRQLCSSAEQVYALGDCAEVAGHVLVYVLPLMACARALGKTLAGEPTEVVYPPMPVMIKVPACPVIVSPPPLGASGEWSIEQDGDDTVAQFSDDSDQLLGFALTGAGGVKQKMRLQKLLPPILA